MNKEERVKLVKAMEYVARQINDENIFANWLVSGVADGDITYGDLDYDSEDEDIEYYISDEEFEDLMDVFVWCMRKAWKSGGLYCDGICSQERGN